jgi:hypothetical protein
MTSREGEHGFIAKLRECQEEESMGLGLETICSFAY